jgi:dihydroorotase
MKSVLIREAHIVDPSQQINETGNLLIKDGKIACWAKARKKPPELEAQESLSVVGLSSEKFIVCPGFVDLHCHLRDPGFEEKETIASGTLPQRKAVLLPSAACPIRNLQSITNR